MGFMGFPIKLRCWILGAQTQIYASVLSQSRRELFDSDMTMSEGSGGSVFNEENELLSRISVEQLVKGSSPTAESILLKDRSISITEEAVAAFNSLQAPTWRKSELRRVTLVIESIVIYPI